MERFPITIKGYEKLVHELEHLKKIERPAVIAAIATAREFGDLSENAEYAAAKEKQGYVEGRIIELEDKVARAEIIDVANLSGDKIKFGATVTLIDDDTEEESRYQIVGEYEADMKLKQISYTSPLARSLIGKRKGELVEVFTPSGSRGYEIKDFSFD